jgi:hypothetical protein
LSASKIANGTWQELQEPARLWAHRSSFPQKTTTKRYKSKLIDCLRFLGLPHAYSYVEFDPLEGGCNGKEGEGYDSDGSSDTVSGGIIPDTQNPLELSVHWEVFHAV